MTNNEQKLLPCPFCGKQPRPDIQKPRSDGRAWTFVWCEGGCRVKPHASGSADTSFYNSETLRNERFRSDEEAMESSKSLAFERWNTRAAPTVAPCCQPSEEELAALKAGDCRPEELWGGPRPTCPKCIAPTVAAGLPERKSGPTTIPGTRIQEGWNACHDAWLAWLSKAAQGLPEPVAWRWVWNESRDPEGWCYVEELPTTNLHMRKVEELFGAAEVNAMAARNAELEAELCKALDELQRRQNVTAKIFKERDTLGAKNAELKRLLAKVVAFLPEDDCDAGDAALADEAPTS